MEQIEDIEEFPGYAASSHGVIMNAMTERRLKPSRTLQGALKVNLRKYNQTYCRSVKVLVARAFVEGEDEINDTVVHKDGDQENCAAWNLVWRPRWFAHSYSFAMKHPHAYYFGRPIFESTRKKVYDSIWSAAIAECLDPRRILESCHEGSATWPDWLMFSFLDEM